jgi:hypothetical protein
MQLASCRAKRLDSHAEMSLRIPDPRSMEPFKVFAIYVTWR